MSSSDTASGNEKHQADDVASVDIVLAADNLSLDDEHKNLGGAPIEDLSPIGIGVGWWTAVFLTTPGTILRQCGSLGLTMIFWVIGFFLSAAGVSYYTELLALFPNRAGADVAYLEQAYNRPKFLVFCRHQYHLWIRQVWSARSSSICAEYILYANGQTDPDPWVMRGIAISAYAIACLIVVTNNRLAMFVSNVFSAFKVLVLCFIVVTGWVVLGGGTRIQDPKSHFKNGFQGTNNNGNALAGALINVIFAYSGWNNANSVANEMARPVHTLKTAGPVALVLVFFLYFFANTEQDPVAYFAAVPIEEAQASGQLLAAKFFTAVFGDYAGNHVLPVFRRSLCLWQSRFGGHRTGPHIQRSCSPSSLRIQGILPFSRFFSSTKPFGTPAAPMLVKFILTTIIIIGPPAGDAFNFIIAIQTYPAQLFQLALVLGVYLIRRRRSKAGLARPEFVAWDVALWLSIAVNLFVLIMAWVPPSAGEEPFSFPYWVPWVTGIGVLLLCVTYWLLWMHVVPRLLGYRIYEEVVQLEHGELSKKFVHVYNDARGDAFRERLNAEKTKALEDSLKSTQIMDVNVMIRSEFRMLALAIIWQTESSPQTVEYAFPRSPTENF
ncbi:amino acid transporter [Hymenopellis radicata]|nr:amino acid transporter [Hymenopellis radicata]